MISYRFRMYPNKEQEEKLELSLEMCRQAYNILLGELRKQIVTDKAQIQAILPDLKICEPKFKQVYSKVLQYECYRLFSNLSALAHLKRKGKKVGVLRFKGKGWFKTMTFNQSGFKLREKLQLSKIGEIKIVKHRQVEGNIKQVVIKKMPSGKWFVIIQTDAVRKMECGTKKIGIDLGIEHFIADSEGNFVEHPHNFDKYAFKLKKAQQDLFRKEKGSKNRIKARLKIAKIHEKVNNSRDDFLHKVSTDYIKKCKILVIEDLNIKGIIRGCYSGKNIVDASWGKFMLMLDYKAESAGCQVIKVNPKNTTQKCSRCNKLVPKKIWNRIHKCPYCHLKIDRDYNSAINILNLASGQGLPEELVEMKPLPLSGQVLSKKQEAPSVREE